MDIAVISRYRRASVRDSNSFLLKALAWAALAVLALVVINLPRPVPINKSLGGYVTTLDGRTRSQRANALRAARRVNGTIIKPGQTFSYNRTVGPWTRDAGYVKAPVSYDGVLVQDWGGGVCQTSTALYNAALIAGLDIPERHRHTRAPRYAPAGRDAAVAPNTADLLIHNPYPWPVRIERLAADSGLGFRFLGAFYGPVAVVETKATPAEEQIEVTRIDPAFGPGRRVINPGCPGVRVTVTRRFLRGPRRGERELITQETYPATNRVIVQGSR